MSKILRYVSDLHLELRETIMDPKLKSIWDFNTEPNDKYYLALLGDIGNPLKPTLADFLSLVSPKYDKIFYIPGNHEYYNTRKSNSKSYIEMKQLLIGVCNKFNNIILLDNDTFELNNIMIIGSTLWSEIDEDKREDITEYINDYRSIKDENGNAITVDHTNKWHTTARQFITKSINNNNNNICIVMTHHSPLFNNYSTKQYTSDPKYTGNNCEQAFQNDLSHLMKKPVAVWLYGHTHYNANFNYNNTIVASNQLGYISEKIWFNSKTFIDLNKLETNIQ